MITFKPHWLAALLMLGGVTFATPPAFAQAAAESEEYVAPAPGDEEGAMINDDDDAMDAADSDDMDDAGVPPAAAGPRMAGDREAMARCSEQFRSFDPATGTYTTYGGEQRPCPYLR